MRELFTIQVTFWHKETLSQINLINIYHLINKKLLPLFTSVFCNGNTIIYSWIELSALWSIELLLDTNLESKTGNYTPRVFEKKSKKKKNSYHWHTLQMEMILCATYKMGPCTRSLRPIQDVSSGCSGQFVSTWLAACWGLNSLSPPLYFLTFSEMKKGCSVHAQMQPQHSVLQGDNIWEYLYSSLESVQKDWPPLVLRSKFLSEASAITSSSWPISFCLSPSPCFPGPSPK